MPCPFPSGGAFPRWGIRRRRICARCLSEIPDFRSSRIAWRFPFVCSGLITSGQAENKMADDVALHFGSAGFDGIAARAQVGVGPHAIVNRVRITAKQLAIRAENFLCDLLQALIELAPENFLDAALGSRHARRGES